MSGLYLIGVIAIWSWLCYLLWKVWRNARENESGGRRIAIDALGIVFGLLWFGASVYYAGGRALLGNLEVDRLCKQDGGIKVYETVTLPAEKFDKYGVIQIPSLDRATLKDEYYYEWVTIYYSDRAPELRKSHFLIWRREDKKLLGESISYHRVGGNLPGPWHSSSYSCQERTGFPELKAMVFTKKIQEENNGATK